METIQGYGSGDSGGEEDYFLEDEREHNLLEQDGDEIKRQFFAKYKHVYLACPIDSGPDSEREDRVIIDIVRHSVGRKQQWQVVTNKLRVEETRRGTDISQLPTPRIESRKRRKRPKGQRDPQPKDYRKTLPIDDDLHEDIRMSRFNLQPGDWRLVKEGEN